MIVGENAVSIPVLLVDKATVEPGEHNDTERNTILNGTNSTSFADTARRRSTAESHDACFSASPCAGRPPPRVCI